MDQAGAVKGRAATRDRPRLRHPRLPVKRFRGALLTGRRVAQHQAREYGHILRSTRFAYPFGVTSITLGLSSELTARLEERAAQAGVPPEEMARMMLSERLAEPQRSNLEGDPSFDFIGIGSSDVLRGSDVDELLAEGFGQFRS